MDDKRDDILKIFNCSSCNKYFTTTPVTKIKHNGEEKYKYRCPACLKESFDENFINILGLEMSFLSKLLEKPVFCKNKECLEQLSVKNYKAHEKLCIYSPVSCVVSECNWKGRKGGMLNHFKNQHSRYFKESTMGSQDIFSFTICTSLPTDIQIAKHFVISTSVGIIQCMFTISKEFGIILSAFNELLHFEEISVEITQANGTKKHQGELDKPIKIENIKPDITTITLKIKTANENSKKSGEIFKCPVCLRMYSMNAPIGLCPTGHSFCDLCRNKGKAKCPMPECGAVYSSERNLKLEAIINDVIISLPLNPEINIGEIHRPCKYELEGCKVRHKDVSNHEEKCLFQKHKCPVSGCDPENTFELHDLSAHMLEKHREVCTIGSSVDSKKFTMPQHYMIYLQNIFIIKWSRDDKNAHNVKLDGIKSNSVKRNYLQAISHNSQDLTEPGDDGNNISPSKKLKTQTTSRFCIRTTHT